MERSSQLSRDTSWSLEEGGGERMAPILRALVILEGVHVTQMQEDSLWFQWRPTFQFASAHRFPKLGPLASKPGCRRGPRSGRGLWRPSEVQVLERNAVWKGLVVSSAFMCWADVGLARPLLRAKFLRLRQLRMWGVPSHTGTKWFPGYDSEDNKFHTWKSMVNILWAMLLF